MTEPQQEPEKPPTLMKLSDLKKMIGDFVDGAMERRSQTQDPEPTGRRTPPARRREQEPQGRSVQDEVDAALKKLEAEKADREWRDSLRKDVDEVKERTKEKAPVERRRVHRLMRWGE